MRVERLKIKVIIIVFLLQVCINGFDNVDPPLARRKCDECCKKQTSSSYCITATFGALFNDYILNLTKAAHVCLALQYEIFLTHIYVRQIRR